MPNIVSGNLGSTAKTLVFTATENPGCALLFTISNGDSGLYYLSYRSGTINVEKIIEGPSQRTFTINGNQASVLLQYSAYTFINLSNVEFTTANPT